jgi:predicted nucleic acid-binding protein
VKICVDSGFLIALYDETDEHHEKAESFFIPHFTELGNELLVPWPVLYETVSTRMTRHRRQMDSLNRDWKYLHSRKQLILLDDKDFRAVALEECMKEVARPAQRYRTLSLADRVIRGMLSDISIRIDYFITYNQKDFVDICRKYRRVMA